MEEIRRKFLRRVYYLLLITALALQLELFLNEKVSFLAFALYGIAILTVMIVRALADWRAGIRKIKEEDARLDRALASYNADIEKLVAQFREEDSENKGQDPDEDACHYDYE